MYTCLYVTFVVIIWTFQMSSLLFCYTAALKASSRSKPVLQLCLSNIVIEMHSWNIFQNKFHVFVVVFTYGKRKDRYLSAQTSHCDLTEKQGKSVQYGINKFCLCRLGFHVPDISDSSRTHICSSCYVPAAGSLVGRSNWIHTVPTSICPSSWEFPAE